MPTTSDNQKNYGVYFQKYHRFNVAAGLLISVLGLLSFLSAVLGIVGKQNNKLGLLFGILMIISLGLFLLYDVVNTMLVISSKGIEYHRGGYTIKASWREIDKVEVRLRRRLEYVLTLKSSTVIANRWQKYLLQMNKGNLTIPLSVFDNDWSRTEIGELIKYFAPDIKIPG